MKVVVAGSGIMSDAHIYNLETNAWEDGGHVMPIPIEGASTLPYGDTFLLIGGTSLDQHLNTTYQFNATTETFDLLEGVYLEQERSTFQAMYVEAQALPKCD